MLWFSLAAVAFSSVDARRRRVQAVDVRGRMLHVFVHPTHDGVGGGAIPGRVLPAARALAGHQGACPSADRGAVGRGHAQRGACVCAGGRGAV